MRPVCIRSPLLVGTTMLSGICVCLLTITALTGASVHSSIFGNSNGYSNGNSNGQMYPVCTSYNALCAVAFNITVGTSSTLYLSDDEMCRCPNNGRCHSEWSDMANSIKKHFDMIHGDTMVMKATYCSLNMPSNNCSKNENVVTLKGVGPFDFKLVGNFSCKCHRNNLFVSKIWIEGEYTFYTYSCGKPRCGSRTHRSRVCKTITNTDRTRLHSEVSEFPCRCQRRQHCPDGVIPPTGTRSFSCQPGSDLPRFRRRRNRV